MIHFGSSNIAQLSDEELIKMYRFSHDEKYLAELFLRYTALVFAVAIKHLKNQKEAEEITLTVFNKISSDLKRYEIKNFSKWLHNLIKNICIVETKKRNATEEESKMILIEELNTDEDEMFINVNVKETADQNIKFDSNNLRIAIDTLSENQKVCIDLFYIQNKSYQEVSEITGFTINQVKTNIQNGKRLLKSYLENKEL
ncbi:MAG: sigma-70 family RNA polymerase sigma factor [Chitinophagales bacterium]|jgi:RNA polymerase sigma-70 factor (ECF subfamily)|nr:sigma-70 family RNA polymerase sigma factor [Chitinophagales bacterium]